MKIVAIVQARMSSSRLPGKVLLDIAGEPMLARVVDRTRRANLIHEVVVATTTDPSDDALVQYCQERAYPFFRGSLQDVLDRTYQAALTYEADVILRITSDCPVIDPGLIDEMVRLFCTGVEEPRSLQFDFAANRLPPPWHRTFPIGLDMEMCSFSALERAWKAADQTYQREHVMPYFYEGLELPGVQPLLSTHHSPRGFRILLLNHAPDYGTLRWTVDTPQDLELLRQVYAHFDGRIDFTWLEVLDLVTRQPELAQINANIAAKHVQETDKRVL